MFTELAGRIFETTIRAWVRVTGRRVAPADTAWLRCPVGPSARVGAAIYEQLAAAENLEARPGPDAGLLVSFDDLRSEQFAPERVHPLIRDFYEHTSRYRLEAWSETGALQRVCLSLLVLLISRRMEQLNLPLSPLELSGGMSNEVIPLVDRASGQRRYTGWLRRLGQTNRVIYAGLYMIEQPPGWPGPCVKVSFPVPDGNATVFLRPENGDGDTFHLISEGKRFGDTGYYRVVGRADGAHWSVRYLPSLRETFRLYVDPTGTTRCEHTVTFFRVPMLRLHYKMERLPDAPPVTQAVSIAPSIVSKASS